MATAQPTTDHDEIRRWVEERGGHPARVKATGSRKDPGVLRIDFPGFSGEDTLEEIPWEEFFEWFDRNGLALLLSDEKGNRFNKLVNRRRASSKKASSAKKSSAKKSSSRRGAKSSSKKSSAKKASSSKKSSAKKASSAKKSSAKKSSAKKSSSKKSSAKKASSSKKSSAKKSSSSKKSPAKKSSAKKSSSRKSTSKRSTSANTTTDHDTIRRWVEERGGFPAHVKRTGGRRDPGVLRIDYPGYSGRGTLERMSWEEWFDAFDKNKLAFLYQDKKNSRFSKLVER